ncbi:MAG: diguanylate cyclase [Gemmatimonadota bacterium]
MEGDLEAVLAGLRREYLADTPARILALRKDAAAFRAGEPDGQASLTSRFHQLAGSAGSYGFDDIGSLAREAEVWLAGLEHPSAADADRVDAVVEAIAAAFNRHASELAAPEGLTIPAEFTWHALVVADPGPIRDQLVTVIRGAGFVVGTTDRLDQPAERPASARPDLVVVGPCGDGDDVLAAAVNWSARRGQRPRAVVLVAPAGRVDRLRALGSGVDAVFSGEHVVTDVGAYARILARIGVPPATVLLVEDDPAQAHLLITWLEQSHIRVIHAPSAMAANDLLARDLPDLILLDVALPEVDGFAFARMVRQDPRYGLLPIVFLTARPTLANHVEAVRSGGDDFLIKPVDQQLLLQVVISRVERGRRVREMAYRDGLTGLINHSTLMAELAYAMELARRSGEEFAFLMVDLDHFKRINDRYGHLVGDQVLLHVANVFRATARASDLIGRYGGEEFGLILRRTGREGAMLVADKLREALAASPARLAGGIETPVRACIGIAVYPQDGTTAASLTRAADQALYRAKVAGRDRVEPGG